MGSSNSDLGGRLRTSDNSPLRLCEVAVPGLTGRFGLTICPGKRGESVFGGGTWWRDLDADLAVIRDWEAGAVLSLLEDHEFELLGIPQFPAVMRAQPFAWHCLNIRDRDVPDARFEDAWPAARAALREVLAQGRGVVVHCRGGIGRTGLVVARFLVEEGMPAEEAITRVRASRPGAIETAAQEGHVRRQLALR